MSKIQSNGYWLECWWSSHDEPQLLWAEMPADDRPWTRESYHAFVGKRATVHVTSSEFVKRGDAQKIAVAFMSGNYRSFNLREEKWTQGQAH